MFNFDFDTANLSYHLPRRGTNFGILGKSDWPEMVRPPRPPRERSAGGGLCYGSLAVRRIAMGTSYEKSFKKSA